MFLEVLCNFVGLFKGGNQSNLQMMPVGKMRYVTVRSFKGKELVDIREYYTDKVIRLKSYWSFLIFALFAPVFSNAVFFFGWWKYTFF